MSGANTLPTLEERNPARSAAPDPRDEPECRPLRGEVPAAGRRSTPRDSKRPPARKFGLTLIQVFSRQCRETSPEARTLPAGTARSPQVILSNLQNSDSVEFDRILTDELDPLPFVVDEDFWISSVSIERPADEGPNAEWPVGVCLVQWQERDHRQLPAHDSINAQSLPPVKCSLRDMNMSGLALQTPEPVAPGTVLDVRILTALGGKVVEAEATIVRCEPSKLQGFQIICRLHRYLTPAEIREIGQALFARAIV
jgi:hypothetical protein